MDKDLGNPFAFGRTADIYAWEPGKVLKLFRPGFPEHHAAYEFETTRKVEETGFRVPAVYEQVTVGKRFGVVYGFVQGELLADRIVKTPWKVDELAKALARTHIDMHKHAAPTLESQKSRLRRKIESVEGAPDDVKQAALSALDSLPDGDQLCHNDFHPANVLFTASGLVTIDWMDGGRGHPLIDVARTFLLLSVGELPPGIVLRMVVSLLRNRFIRVYLDEYFWHSAYQRAEMDAWLFPVAFGRFSEDIPEERGRLEKLVRNLFQTL